MFDVGLLELVVIVGVALVAIGPDRMPEAARFILKAMRVLRKLSGDVRSFWNELESTALTDTPKPKQDDHEQD